MKVRELKHVFHASLTRAFPEEIRGAVLARSLCLKNCAVKYLTLISDCTQILKSPRAVKPVQFSLYAGFLQRFTGSEQAKAFQALIAVFKWGDLCPKREAEGVNDVLSKERIHVGSPLLYVDSLFWHSLAPLSVFCRQTSDRQVVVSEKHYIPGKGRSGTPLSGRVNAAGADEMKVVYRQPQPPVSVLLREGVIKRVHRLFSAQNCPVAGFLQRFTGPEQAKVFLALIAVFKWGGLCPKREAEGVNDVLSKERIHVGSPLFYGFMVVEHSLAPLSVFCRQTSDRQVVVSEKHYIPGKGRSGTLLSGRVNAAGADEMKFPEWSGSFELPALGGGEK